MQVEKDFITAVKASIINAVNNCEDMEQLSNILCISIDAVNKGRKLINISKIKDQ
jgi:hypothetical protein